MKLETRIPPKIWLVGSEGQVGFELRGPLSSFAEIVSTSHRALDVGDADAVNAYLREHAPDVVVNASAFTDVDGAERDPAPARRINCDAVRALGLACKARGVGLVHVSTDFVFDGAASRPYAEADPCRPINAYGQSKRDGELALLEIGAPAVILRTAWVYSLRKKSFVSAILSAARAREELRVVADQIGSPTYCRDFAIAVALFVRGLGARPAEAIAEAAGVWHLAGSGVVSRYDLARAAIDLDPRRAEQKVKEVVPIATADMPSAVARPLYSALDSSAFEARFGLRLPHWREALERALAPSLV